MRIDAEAVIGRRRDQQARLIAHAERFVAQLNPSLDVRAVVVFGSVARGDFNVWSDVDVLVVAESLPDGQIDRLASLGPPQALVQPVAWTEAELGHQLRRSNPIAVEVRDRGIWLRGTSRMLGPVFHTATADLGVATVNLDRALQLAGELEDDEVGRKSRTGK